MKLTFSIPGEPRGKERPRVTRTGHAYTPQKTVDYENTVKWIFWNAFRGAFFEQGRPVEMKITAYFGIPKSTAKKNILQMKSGAVRPVKKSDLDNIAKIVMDSGNGLFFHDDSQVVDLTVRKFYSENPRVDVEISDATIRSDWMG